MNNLPEAYRGADEHVHHVCAYCPDKEEAEALARGYEKQRELGAMMEGLTDYFHRRISHTICPPCLQEELRKVGDIKSFPNV